MKNRVALLIAVAVSAGCGGAVPPSSIQQADLVRLTAQTGPCPCLYVAEYASNAVAVYAGGAARNARPLRRLAGTRTGLNNPFDVAVAADGTAYVANEGNSTVTVYAPDADGNVKPVQTIAGAQTGLDVPEGVALDPLTGDIYVANGSGGSSNLGSITSYPSGANGNVLPAATIAGAATGLDQPTGIVFDAAGNLYVPNHGDSITVYAPGSVGDAAPEQDIAGPATGLALPWQIGLDSAPNIYVVNSQSPYSITEYAAGSTGNVAPIRTITGARTKLDLPDGLALDGNGDIYAADYGVSWITEYAGSAAGNARPINVIRGRATKLAHVEGITIR
jgi:serine/threonine protein kinase, bacterial